MKPHIEISELICLRDGAQPPARAEELQAHLQGCAQCRDELAQLEMNDALAADLRALREANLTAIPAEIDRRVWAGLAESLKTGSGRARMNPSRAGRKRQHPKAPRIPNYTLHRRIGQGAFGEVWEAQDRTGLACAIKVIQHAVKDYEFEGIKKARGNPHPNLVAIPHVGFHRRRLYYVMEFVPELLAVRLAAGQPLSVEAALEHVRSLLEAIAFLYSTGLAHRDIKPENIGFAADGTLKLLDLGLVTGADRTDATRVGTELYMPRVPGPTPAQDDLYAVGKVLYFMLTGEKPPAELPSLTAAERGAGQLVYRLHQAARQAAAPEPAGRFSSAGEFLATIISELPRKKSPGAACNPSNGSSGTTTQTQDMNTTQQTQDLINEAADLVGKAGQEQRRQVLLREAAKIIRPKFKVVIVGQFKSGKSTLINLVLLREDLLFADLMEATAVPTEIEYSDQKYLDVYPRRVQTDTLTVGAGDTARSVQVEGGVEATAPIRTLNPTPEDIKRATTAADAEGRARLARETARVRIGWPAPTLAEVTFVDTAGINSTNEAVVETTYRIIPEADVVIFVTPARQLDQVDRAFLRGRVFAEGVSRCMVVVNHNSKHASLDPAQLEHIRADVRADLKSFGRAHIPVELINLGGQAEHRESVDAFRSKLQPFLAENVLPGRIERSRTVLRRELAQARLECAAELAALQKTPTERQVILNTLQAESRELERRYNRLVDALIADLKIIHEEHLKGLDLGMDQIRDEYLAGLRACDGLTAMQKTLEAAPSLLKAPAENMFFNVAADTRKRVAQLEEKYNANLREATTPWQRAITAQLGIGDDLVTTVLKKTPPPVLTVIDVLLSDWLMWGGVIWGVIWRFVFSKLPVIRDFLPSNLFKGALIAWIDREVVAQFAKTKAQLRENAVSVFPNVEDQVRTAWMDHMNAQTTGVTGSVEATLDAPKDPARHNLLQASVHRLDELLRQAQ